MRRLGREEWRALVAEYEAGELEQKEFAAKHDVSVCSLQYNLYRFRKESSNRSSVSGATFVPVEVVASPATLSGTGLIEVSVRAGIAIRFAVGTDARYLAELLSSIG